MKWTMLRAIGLIVAAAFVVFGLGALRDGIRLSRGIDRAKAEDLAAISVDVSRPGEWTGEYAGYVVGGHGVRYGLRFSKERRRAGESRPAVDDIAPALEQIAGALDVHAPTYDASMKREIGREELPKVQTPGCDVVLGHSMYADTGRHLFTLTVTEGVPELAGKPHWFVIEYELCGMENLLMQFCLALGAVAILISAAIAIPVLRRMRRDARTAGRPQCAQTPPN